MSSAVAIMQPYIFPYIGYMNLVNASDIFVFYDDVTFIKQGWINRNRIILNGEAYKFTLPLRGASSYKFIRDIELNDRAEFAEKFLGQLKSSYKNSPYLNQAVHYVESTLFTESNKVGDLAATSVINFFDYLGVEKKFVKSSETFSSTIGKGKAERLASITKALNSDQYVNAIGGTDLYSKEHFLDMGVELNFVKPNLKQYEQSNSKNFVAGLSIIDLIMNLSKDEIIDHVHSYELV